MAACRALRWLAICSILGAASCGGDAAAPRRVVGPVDRATPSAPASSTPSPSAPPASTPAPSAPNAAVDSPGVVEPTAPPPEPVAALPPCPDDRQRDEARKPDDVVRLAELADAMTVVDLGSGDGYFLCRLSRAVGARGHVIATEITRPLVRDLEKRVAREKLSNVEVILAPTDDVGIAPGSADRILVVHVWHHLTDRKRYASRIARALAPGGKVVVVDFRPSRGSGHGIAPERVVAELATAGIDGGVIPEDLPNDYVIIGSVRAPTSGSGP